MHVMLIILTSFAVSVSLSVMRLKSAVAFAFTPRAVCVGSFGAAFAKCLRPLVSIDSLQIYNTARLN